MITLEDLEYELRAAAKLLRGHIETNDYKYYLLRLLLVKRLSDLFEEEAKVIEQKTGSRDLAENSPDKYRFFIPEGSRWSNLQRIKENVGDNFNKALVAIEDANPKFQGIFANTDFNRWEKVGDHILLALIRQFSSLNLRHSNLAEADVIGRACKELLEKSAFSQGQKGGEATTPPQVATLLIGLVEPREGMHICDPVCGMGGLLVECTHQIENQKGNPRNVSLYGQEINRETWATAKINLLFHDIFEFDIRLGDTIRDPQLVKEDGELKLFDRVIAHPPLNLSNWGYEIAQSRWTNRFRYGTPPDTSGDFAFIQHVVATLNETGKAAVLISHGGLFRRGAEAEIRGGIIRDDLIEAVIGLAPKLLYGSSIPAVILVLNRNKEKNRQGNILFIDDASREYQAGKNQNSLGDEDIKRIIEAYSNFQEQEGYAKLVSREQLAADDYILDIKRYVTPPKLKVDIEAEINNLRDLEAKRTKVESEINECLRALGIKI
jgi:type I restriction enzyme M protein